MPVQPFSKEDKIIFDHLPEDVQVQVSTYREHVSCSTPLAVAVIKHVSRCTEAPISTWAKAVAPIHQYLSKYFDDNVTRGALFVLTNPKCIDLVLASAELKKSPLAILEAALSHTPCTTIMNTIPVSDAFALGNMMNVNYSAGAMAGFLKQDKTRLPTIAALSVSDHASLEESFKSGIIHRGDIASAQKLAVEVGLTGGRFPVSKNVWLSKVKPITLKGKVDYLFRTFDGFRSRPEADIAHTFLNDVLVEDPRLVDELLFPAIFRNDGLLEALLVGGCNPNITSTMKGSSHGQALGLVAVRNFTYSPSRLNLEALELLVTHGLKETDPPLLPHLLINGANSMKKELMASAVNVLSGISHLPTLDECKALVPPDKFLKLASRLAPYCADREEIAQPGLEEEAPTLLAIELM